jgi:hypothetical protein
LIDRKERSRLRRKVRSLIIAQMFYSTRDFGEMAKILRFLIFQEGLDTFRRPLA